MAARALYATRFANGKKLLEVYARDVIGLATSLRGSDEHSMLPLGGVVANSYRASVVLAPHPRSATARESYTVLLYMLFTSTFVLVWKAP